MSTTTLDRCKSLLSIGAGTDTSYLEFCIELVETLIKGYCGIEEVPASVQSLVIRKVITNYNRDGGSFTSTRTDTQAGPLTSIKRGDVAYGFASNSDEAKKGFMGAVSGEWSEEEKAVLDSLREAPSISFLPAYPTYEEIEEYDDEEEEEE